MILKLEQFVLLVEEAQRNDCAVLLNGSIIIGFTHDVENEELYIECHDGVYFYRLDLDRLNIYLTSHDVIEFDDKQIVVYGNKKTTKELLTTLDYFAD